MDGVGSDIDKKDDRLAGGHWAMHGAGSDINNKVDPIAGGPWADEEEMALEKPRISRGQEGQQHVVSAIATAQEATILVVVHLALASTTGDVIMAQRDLRIRAAERRAADAQEELRAAEARLAETNRPDGARFRRLTHDDERTFFFGIASSSCDSFVESVS
jgi:hypothetical protein